MSYQLQKKNGAVFYLDILGFAALTQNKIKLDNKDYAAWNIPKHLHKDNQTLAATILVEFREVLFKWQTAYSHTLTIAQLSDCAFVWSENIGDVIIAASNIMWDCIKKGILCRGGLSCGEIIETNANNQLGRLILGEAVSNAARLEECGAKGARIMTTPDMQSALHRDNEDLCNRIFSLFQELENTVDFIKYDEFKWYYIANLSYNVPYLHCAPDDFIVEQTVERIKLSNSLLFDPHFRWNAKTDAGKAQLNPSVAFISADEQCVFKVKHTFGYSEINDMPRTNSQLDTKNKYVAEWAKNWKKEQGVIYFPDPE